MPKVTKSAIVAAPCERLFDLVEACESYPDFLPWCEAAEVIERTREATTARLHVGFRGLKTTITTRNRKSRPRSLSLELVEGPFERFDGEWRFSSLGDEGCRAEFSLDYRLAGGPLAALLAPVFAHIADTMVESFVRRAGERA